MNLQSICHDSPIQVLMTVATSDPSLSLYIHVNVSQYVRPVLVDLLDLQSVADDCWCIFFFLVP
jgi:hypothetical protein